MSADYVRLTSPEQTYGESNLLQSEVLLLTMMQQYQAMLQMQLAGQMQPGGDAMMEGQGQPQGGGGGGIPAAPPQAAGSPLEQVDQMPDVNQMRGMIQ